MFALQPNQVAVYPVVCANEKEAIVKFARWMHKHYQNSLNLAWERAERDELPCAFERD